VLDNIKEFMKTPLIKKLSYDYSNKRQLLASAALRQLEHDLMQMREADEGINGINLLTSLEFRVKKEKSFFEKLFNICKEHAAKEGVSDKLIKSAYESIKDVAGARFAVPYYDDVIPTVKHLRKYLSPKGYGVELRKTSYFSDTKDEKRSDKDDKSTLDEGDSYGYRSYHFYVMVPTAIDIYGEKQPMLVEIQGRSELQHVWAVKSHDLIYKNGGPPPSQEKSLKKTMKLISNSLRDADHRLNEVRDMVNDPDDGSSK